MDAFIRSRLQDPRFNSAPVHVRTGHEVTRWAPLDTTVTRVNASGKDMTMHHDAYKSDKKEKDSPKKRKKEDSNKSEKESGGEDDDKSPKKKKKKKESDGDKDDKSGRCWKG